MTTRTGTAKGDHRVESRDDLLDVFAKGEKQKEAEKTANNAGLGQARLIGVTTTARRPNSRAPSMTRGVSLLPMNREAMRPDKP